MMISHTKNPVVFSGLGFVVIPDWHYEDLVSENQIKRDRIEELNLKVQYRDEHIDGLKGHLVSEQESAENRIKELETTSDRQKATIQDMREQIARLDLCDRTNNEVIDDLNANLYLVKQNLQAAQRDLDAVKEVYTKTLAANAELDKKLGEAIANLTTTELHYNEQTVQIATLQTNRNTLLTELDGSKRAVNIELDNHRIAILKAMDNLERSLRYKGAES